MSTHIVTLDAVRSVLPLLPEDATNPSVNGTCVYTDPFDPERHCIAGEVFTRLGVPLPDVADGENGVGVNTDAFDRWCRDVSIELDQDARVYLMHLQSEADRGKPWGIAIRDVEEA